MSSVAICSQQIRFTLVEQGWVTKRTGSDARNEVLELLDFEMGPCWAMTRNTRNSLQECRCHFGCVLMLRSDTPH